MLLLCGDPPCGRLEKKCWITRRSDWLGTQMCSSPEAVGTSALELFLLLDKSAAGGEIKEDKKWHLLSYTTQCIFCSLREVKSSTRGMFTACAVLIGFLMVLTGIRNVQLQFWFVYYVCLSSTCMEQKWYLWCFLTATRQSSSAPLSVCWKPP